MNLYFAGTDNEGYFEIVKRMKVDKFLFSYYYLVSRNPVSVDSFLKKTMGFNQKIFLDSGAFSAYTRGAVINIDEYINFIKENSDILTGYANLDVIGNERETMKNQLYMESKGLNPLPVFHYKESWNYLRSLVKDYNYIALGGLVPIARKKNVIVNHLSKCFSIIRDSSKVHGFGLAADDLLKSFPFYSVDSTSWLNGAKFLTVYFFNMGQITQGYIGDKDTSTFKTIQLVDSAGRKWIGRTEKNVAEFIKFEKFVTELWEKRGVFWND